MSPLWLSCAACSAVLLLSEEAGGHADKFLGIPLWIWQIVNMVLFIAVLLYFIAKPMAAAFRKRQAEIEEKRRQAEKERAEVEHLSADIRERTAKMEREIEEIRKQGAAQGESARSELAVRARLEAERVDREAQEEIARRLTAAKAELSQAAAELTASSARAILTREITGEDRQRLLDESVEKMKASAR